MFNLFKKKKTIELKAPVIGNAVELSKVPDEVFASKMLGDGLAIEPAKGTLYSPCDGEVIQVFPTKHAVGIRTKEGIEILLHIGVDTVTMNGQGFESLVSAGDNVYEGQSLVNFDIELIGRLAKSTVTPLLITNMDIVDSVEFNYGETTKNSVVAVVNLK